VEKFQSGKEREAGHGRKLSMKPVRLLSTAAALLAMNLPLPAQEAPVIYMIGDSTMANKNTANGNPERGWGQLLPEYFPAEVKIVNKAKDGRSTKSFLDEGLWTPVLEALKPGDWVIIEFGHNDQKKDKPSLYADPETDFQNNLKKFATETREKGASPILATPIYRRYFTPEGQPKSTAGAYPEATRKVAAGLSVPLVDLHERTKKLLEEYGVEKSKVLFLHFAAGELALYPTGRADNSHLCEEGARKVAGLFVEGLKEQKMDLARWLSEPAKTPAP
jgi:lysophospholipase L1-like esterase